MSKVKSNKKNKDKLIRHERGRPAFIVVEQKTFSHQTSGLYTFVYRSATALAVSCLLISSFLLQGVYVVYANEAETGTVVAVEIPDDSLTVETSPNLDPDSDSESSVELTEEPVVLSDPEITVTDASELDILLGLTGASSVMEGEIVNKTETEVTSNFPEDTPTEESGGEILDDSLLYEKDLPTDEMEATSTVGTTSVSATTVVKDDSATEPIGPALTEPITVTYSDSGYSFSKNECTELASGSFYCVEPRHDLLKDALFAAPDAEGDLEIFLVRDNIQTQITDNFVDDAAPYYDQNSHTIVWHRLIADRYQIVSYDIEQRTETVLTENNTNDMEPTRQGKYTVWQRWVGNNWDIILHDGRVERQISHSPAHDIAPYVHGTLVVWNRYTMTGDKTVEMYDIANESYVTVDDPAGLTVSNPRMVLVYDQLHPNGDIVTKGYDMIARSFIALDTLPRELPDEVPGSEPTSETRALIQVKPTVKGDELSSVDTEGDGDPQPYPETSLASTSDALTLDLTTPEMAVERGASTDLTEFDLIIEAFSTHGEVQDSAQATSS